MFSPAYKTASRTQHQDSLDEIHTSSFEIPVFQEPRTVRFKYISDAQSQQDPLFEESDAEAILDNVRESFDTRVKETRRSIKKGCNVAAIAIKYPQSKQACHPAVWFTRIKAKLQESSFDGARYNGAESHEFQKVVNVQLAEEIVETGIQEYSKDCTGAPLSYVITPVVLLGLVFFVYFIKKLQHTRESAENYRRKVSPQRLRSTAVSAAIASAHEAAVRQGFRIISVASQQQIEHDILQQHVSGSCSEGEDSIFSGTEPYTFDAEEVEQIRNNDSWPYFEEQAGRNGRSRNYSTSSRRSSSIVNPDYARAYGTSPRDEIVPMFPDFSSASPPSSPWETSHRSIPSIQISVPDELRQSHDLNQDHTFFEDEDSETSSPKEEVRPFMQKITEALGRSAVTSGFQITPTHRTVEQPSLRSTSYNHCHNGEQSGSILHRHSISSSPSVNNKHTPSTAPTSPVRRSSHSNEDLWSQNTRGTPSGPAHRHTVIQSVARAVKAPFAAVTNLFTPPSSPPRSRSSSVATLGSPTQSTWAHNQYVEPIIEEEIGRIYASPVRRAKTPVRIRGFVRGAEGACKECKRLHTYPLRDRTDLGCMTPEKHADLLAMKNDEDEIRLGRRSARIQKYRARRGL